MPIIKPDLKDINKPIEPGTYASKIEAPITAKESKAGNSMLVIPVKVTVGEKEYKRTLNQVITGPGAFGFAQLLRATGFGDYADRLQAGSEEPWDADQLIGQRFMAVIESDTYNGQLTDKITGYLPA